MVSLQKQINQKENAIFIDDFLKEKQYWNEIIVLNPKAKSVYENQTYQQLICEDAIEYYNYQSCNFSLSKEYPQMLQNTYNLTDQQKQMIISNNFTSMKYKSTLFHIRFLNTTQTINSTKQLIQLTIQIYYNESLLDSLQIQHPDRLAMLVNSDRQNPYWSGYTIILQKLIDQSLTKQIANCNLDYTLSRLPDYKQTSLTAGMFFGIGTQISWCVLLILSTALTSNQRGKSHIVLKRLGVSNVKFWISNTLLTLILTFCSSMITIVVWKNLNVVPYQYVSWPMGFGINSCIAICISIQAQFISLFFGNKTTISIIASCIVSGIFILYPTVQKIQYQQQSFYDPSMWRQRFKILLLFLFPGYNVTALESSILVHISSEVMNYGLANYKFVGPLISQTTTEEGEQIDIPLQQGLVGVRSLWKSEIYDTQQLCYNIYSKKGIQHPYLYSCCYYNYRFINNCYLSVIYLVVYTLFLCYLSLVLPDVGFRPFPIYFIFDKRYYQSKKKQPLNSSVYLQNVNVIFKVHSLNIKKRKQVHASKDFTFILEENQIQSLLGETGQGKSVFLSTLCGETSPINKKEYTHWKQLKYNYKNPVFKLFGTYDLTNPYDAYFVKKHIGYCPQEMSNVWPSQSVFNNVYYTILIRTKLKGIKYTKKEIKNQAKLLLHQLDLSDALNKKPSELSGGMLRRLALANSIAGQPTLLVLDEITSGVDSVVKFVMFNTIQDYVKKNNCSAIISSHDTSEIQQATKYITLLDAGKTLYSNVPISQLYDNMKVYELTIQGQNNQKLSKIFNQINYEYNFRLILEENILSTKRTEFIFNFEHQDTLQLIYEELVQFQKEQNAISQPFQFMIQKAQLRTFYHRLLTQRHFEEEQQAQDKNKTFTLNKKKQKIQKHSSLGKIPALFKIFFKEDQKTFFVCQIITIILVIFLTVIFSMLYKIVPQMALVAQIVEPQLRSNSFQPCFKNIDRYLPPTMRPLDSFKNCLMNRNSYLCQQIFDKKIKDYNANRCGYYLRFYGFDEPEPYRFAVGPNQDYFAQPVTFTVVDQNQYKELDMTFADYDPNQLFSKANIDVDTLRYYQHNQYDSDYFQNQLLNNIPKIKDSLNNRTRVFTYGLSQCFTNCNDLVDQCPTYDNTRCLQLCDSLNVTPSFQQQYLEYTPAIIINNEKEVLDYYNQLNKEINITVHGPQNYYFSQFLANFYASRRLSVGHIKFDQLQVENNKLKNIKYNFSTILPYGGSSKDFYPLWSILVKVGTNYTIDCNTMQLTPNSTQNFRYYPAVAPSASGWGKYNQLSPSYQGYPYRRHVTILDSQSQVINDLTNGILNMNSDNNIYEYTLESVAMPRFSDSNMTVSLISYVYTIYALPLLICPILEGFHVASRYGQDIQDRIEALLQYRQISQLDIIITRLIYFIIIQTILITIYIAFTYYFCTDLFTMFYYGKQSILWSYLSGISVIITTMLTCKLSKGSKTCINLLVLFLFGSILSAVLGISSEIICGIFGFIIPSYIFLLLINTGLIGIPQIRMQYYGIGIMIFQLLVLILSSSSHYDFKISLKKNKIFKELKSHKNKIAIMNKKLLTPQDLKQNEKQAKNITFKAKNVFYSYDNQQITLNNVSLQVQNNKIFGLLGQNGCGKSTLIQNIVGMYQPQFGVLALKKTANDKLYTNLQKFNKTSRYVAVVPQTDIYFEKFTLLEHMILFSQIELGYIDYQKIEKLLKILQISQYADQPLKTLSGGSKRRSSIAFALVGRPRLLILDEVTTGVGDTVKRSINKSIFQAQIDNPNMACIVVTHDMEECQILLDDCVIMAKGNVLVSGKLNQIVHKVKLNCSLQLQDFDIQDSNNKFLIDQLKQRLQVETTYINGNDIELIFNQHVTYEQILQQIVYSSLNMSNWNIQQPDFEAVFVKIIKDFNQVYELSNENLYGKEKQQLLKEQQLNSNLISTEVQNSVKETISSEQQQQDLDFK